jgi:hypothetical protein
MREQTIVKSNAKETFDPVQLIRFCGLQLQSRIFQTYNHRVILPLIPFLSQQFLSSFPFSPPFLRTTLYACVCVCVCVCVYSRGSGDNIQGLAHIRQAFYH